MTSYTYLFGSSRSRSPAPRQLISCSHSSFLSSLLIYSSTPTITATATQSYIKHQVISLLRAIPFRVIFFLFFPYLILSHSFIAFAPSDLADSDHHDAITWPHLLSSIGYEDTDSLSSGKPMDNPHALCHMSISSL